MSSDVERFGKECETCLRLFRKNPPDPLSSRVLPNGSWQILQVDFLSIPRFGTGELVVVVNFFSCYFSVVEMKHKDADNMSTALCEVFQNRGSLLSSRATMDLLFKVLNLLSSGKTKSQKSVNLFPLADRTDKKKCKTKRYRKALQHTKLKTLTRDVLYKYSLVTTHTFGYSSTFST